MRRPSRYRAATCGRGDGFHEHRASQIASVASSLAFGYIVGYTGNYNLPFVPMVLTLSIGIVLWMTIDPAHQLFEERESLAA